MLITILVGFSVDYTVHLAVAYMDRRGLDGTDRDGRTLRAVSTLGVSIVAGATTTACACAFLLPSTIVFLAKFGVFMLSAVGSSFFYAMVVFPALLATCGPAGDRHGDVRAFCRRHAPDHAAEESPGVALSVAMGRVAVDDTASTPWSPMDLAAEALKWPDDYGAIGEHLAVATKQARSEASAAERRAARCGLGACVLLALALLMAVVLTGVLVGNTPLPTAEATMAVEPVHMPTLSELADGEWTELRPGGSTVCSRGTPFSFFVKRGTAEHVILEFMGGGACWSVETCGLRRATFRESIEDLAPFFRESAAAASAAATVNAGPPPPVGTTDAYRDAGIADRASEVYSYTHVYVPYCTGDLHWGNATVAYLEDTVVRHRGAVNAQSAVEWVLANLPSPQVLFVTGCSAGAYGSLLWAARLAPIYRPRGTRVVQFGDSGMGIVTEEFMRDAYSNWNTADVMPWDIFPTEKQGNRTNTDMLAVSLANFYAYAAAANPNATFSQYTSAYDENQAFFRLAMIDGDAPRGEPPLSEKLAWAAEMRGVYANTTAPTTAALAKLPNYLQWIGNGDEHCILPYNRYWWAESAIAGSLAAWVNAMIDGAVDELPRLVDCQDTPGACAVGLAQI